jgi:putative transposase
MEGKGREVEEEAKERNKSGEERYEVRGEMSEAIEERVRALEWMGRAESRESYRERQGEVSKRLGVTVRQVQRLMRKWEEEGIKGIERKARSDVGMRWLEVEWVEYIIETYRSGNRGGRRMSRAQVAVRVAARAMEKGESHPPSRTSVYRVLASEIEEQKQRQRRRSIGWQGETLILKTREGLEVEVKESNQVWQCDHTRVDLLVVDQVGEVLGRPWLTTVIDTYSRCIVGIHLGMEAPSAVVVCLALRHAILPKQYSSAYKLTQDWGTYGVPRYLYTDGGKDFQSKHLEQVASELKIVLCQRRYPAEGGIVERPFGSLNSELFMTLPGYTGNTTKRRPKQAESSASLTLLELEKYIVRYLVERYNQGLDARIGNQTRLGRWAEGGTVQLALMSERELDICLMRRDRRVVYRGGYIQFANLSYRGEYLEGYIGSWVVLRYNPRDITSIMIYREEGGKDTFLSRAHASGLETESLSYAEAQAMSRRLRQEGRSLSNASILNEVRSRDQEVEEQRRQGRLRPRKKPTGVVEPEVEPASTTVAIEVEEEENPAIEVPDVRVFDYDAMREEFELW